MSSIGSVKAVEALRGALRLLKARAPELFIFWVGLLLRVSMSWNFKPTWAYDYWNHVEVAKWMLEHHAVPPSDAMRESFHPPLFYALWATLMKLGVSEKAMIFVPIVFGTLRLALIWLGLELYVKDRSARLAGLALAAVCGASVHLDGMVYPEALNNLLTTASMLLGAALFRRQPRKRWRLAAVAGVVLALSMLTKISAVVVVLALGTTALLEFLLARRRIRFRIAAALPLALTFGVCALGCGWYFARNLVEHHALFVTSFDLGESVFVAESNKIPYFLRRPADYVFGWTPAIFYFPYFGSAIEPRPQFFPVAVVSTFVDYWNYSFFGLEHLVQTPLHVSDGSLLPDVLRASQYGALGGTVIFVASTVAWVCAVVVALRRKAFAELSLLLVPPFMLLSALHFAVKYPVDRYGVVKGVYIQFGAPALFAAFGLAVSWSRKKADRWPLFGLLLASLWCVATYTVYCRLRIPMLPVGS
ncbi:MAG TPA: glycosyltransferase family 39 protein [Polyangiaceae bacterium]|nr:glycosyltransferase family 39 protein [Polyangiaceae bacterium]